MLAAGPRSLRAMNRPLSRLQALALAAAPLLVPARVRAQTPTIRLATGLADSYAGPLYANDGVRVKRPAPMPR